MSAEGDFFGSGFISGSSLQRLPCLHGGTQLHTKVCSHEWLCSGRTTRNVLSLPHKWLVEVVHSHKWRSGPGLSKGSPTTEMPEFIILHLNLLFFFFLLLVCLTQRNTKINLPRRPDYSILSMSTKKEHMVLFCTLKSAPHFQSASTDSGSIFEGFYKKRS